MKREGQLEVVVTSGGTISPVDDVRHIGNFSRGTTGAIIAEEFLKAGAKVHYVYGYGADMPFKRNAVMDFDSGFGEGIWKVENAYHNWRRHESNLELHSAPTFDKYYMALRDLLCDCDVDAIVSVAAVNDYKAKKQKGKISSDKDRLIIELEKTEKVINKFKRWNPLVYQVGFKLLSGVSCEELVDVAYEHGRKNGSNFTVANLKENLDDTTYLVYPSYTSQKIRRENLPGRIVEATIKYCKKKILMPPSTDDLGEAVSIK